MKRIILKTLLLLFVLSSCQQAENAFVKIENGEFMVEGKPYYYVGTNFWYGALLASKGEGGNRERLAKELDLLQSVGINNLRVLVGADGPNGVPTKVEPTLQTEPGVYNDEVLDGLDYLMAELSKRGMHAVLYLNNTWEWSGGYSQYLMWAGKGRAPIPSIDGHEAFGQYVSQYAQCDSAKALFRNHVRNIVARTNRYTNRPYTQDPALFSWQIGNEPRPYGEQNKEAFAEWMADIASLIKELDPNHLVSTGNEGFFGSQTDYALFERIHIKDVDYFTIHIWPYNWGWAKKDSLTENLPRAIETSMKYIDDHLAIAKRHNKPTVLEEFGYPRDNFQFALGSPTTARDGYYQAIFSKILQSKSDKEGLAGCNFWAWGGYANPSSENIFWKRGDDYCGDPAQEEQGLNSVFASDSTIEIIRAFNRQLSE